jgi:hypothetical protein
MIEEMNASRKEMLAKMERMMNTNQTHVKLNELNETVEKTHRECEERTSADMKASQEATKTETAPETMQSIEEHEEIPKENAAVMPVEELRKWRRDRNMDARRRRIQQERTQKKEGCRKDLVAVRRAAVTWRRINVLRKILTHEYC